MPVQQSSPTHMTTNIVFIDSQVQDHAALTDSLGPDTEWFLLNRDEDGVVQMQRVLANYSDLDAIHIVSHGAPGTLYLGNTVITSANLTSYQNQWQAIGQSLGETGDILLYGCNVAQKDVGISFVDSLAQMSGADVASSNDVTGATAHGGDWVLESSTGTIDVIGFQSSNYLDLLALSSAATFSAGAGKVTTDFGRLDDTGYSVTLQADGKIIVAGASYAGSNRDFAVARYNKDGSLDASFSGDGKVTTDIGGGNDSGSDVKVQADGKIVVAGYTTIGRKDFFAVVRYNADGSLDTSFDEDGKLVTEIGYIAGSSFYTEGAFGIDLQVDGKILVAGFSGFASTTGSGFALVRYNTNGSLDKNFDQDGRVITYNLGSGGDDVGYSVTLQADGKILVAGSSWSGFSMGAIRDLNFALARYNIDGSLDSTFSGDGKLTTSFQTMPYSLGDLDVANSVIVQPDGKILLAGYANWTYHADFALSRYNADGSLDITFSGDGVLTTDVGGFDGGDGGRDVVMQADGKILVVGWSVGKISGDIAIVRYNSDGSLDTSFSGDGKVTTDISGNYDDGLSVTVQDDGKILVAGQSRINGFYDFALVRYNTDGSLDVSFSSNHLPTGTVEISGTATEGQTLVVTNTLADADGLGTIIVYQWLADGAVISGETGSSLTLAQAQVGKAISVLASYTDSFGTQESRASTATATVANIDDEATGTLAVTGTAAEGGTLTASLSDMVDADGTTTTTWQWQISANGSSGWSNLAGATGASYAIAPDQSQVGQYLRVVATSTDALEGRTTFTGSPIVVTNVNDLPQASTVSAATREDTPLTASVSATDMDGDSLTYTTFSQPQHGSLVFNPNGNYTYTPSDNYAGTDSFTFKANDGTADSNIATVSITVNPLNDVPVIAIPLTDRSIPAGAALKFTITANTFTDVDGDTLSFTAALSNGSVLPGWLTFNPTSRTFSGTPSFDDVGTLSVRITANDGSLSASDIFSLSVSRFSEPVIDTSLSVAYIKPASQYTLSFDPATQALMITDPSPQINETRKFTQATRIEFDDLTLNLSVSDLARTIPQPALDRITELYVAFFNRVPDGDGMEYWIGQYKNGKSINDIAESFYSAGVFFSNLTGYTANMTNDDFINIVYRNVLGRPEGADQGGLDFWRAELTSGRASKGTLVSAILDAAHGVAFSDPNNPYHWVQKLLDNKLDIAKTVSVEWGVNYNTSEDSISKGMAIAAAVTSEGIDDAIGLVGVNIETLVV